ncbi:MAG: membrane protein insertion efficiency factor YidD [Elusimicrobiota bacterium]
MLRYLPIGLIYIYKYLSRFFFPLPVCRFSPSCSDYAIASLKKYGLFKGGFFAALRLIRCNPFVRGGYDPVNPAPPSRRRVIVQKNFIGGAG